MAKGNIPLEHGNIDRNFDDLSARFVERIYGGHKGNIRLKILVRDMSEMGIFTEHLPRTVLDAGGGFAWFSQQFALRGSQATVVDISQNMLDIGIEQWEQKLHSTKEPVDPRTVGQITWKNIPLQEETGCYDMVLCHAVMEWLEKPFEMLDHISTCVYSGGWLSLLFFNHQALIWKNILYGKVDKVLDNTLQGHGTTFTPLHAFHIPEVQAYLEKLGFEIYLVSGVRVFHDYMAKDVVEQVDFDKLLELEMQYSRVPTYSNMARYIHFLCRKRS